MGISLNNYGLKDLKFWLSTFPLISINMNENVQ